MDLEAFKASLGGDAPPAGASGALKALWHQAKGEWDRAHRFAQAEDNADGAWVHAHLHRVEGNLANAAYWYRRSTRSVSSAPLTEEWDVIAAALTD
jgi:hypothetical protein